MRASAFTGLLLSVICRLAVMMVIHYIRGNDFDYMKRFYELEWDFPLVRS